MIWINGTPVYEEPSSCGTCPFFSNGSTQLSSGSEKGHCRLFNEMHRTWINPPRRCHKLFKKALTFPEGEELVLINK